MQETKDIVHDLNDLLTRNYDAEKGYLKAAEKVKHTGLKNYMEARAQNRYDFGHALKEIIRNMGGEVDKGTSTEGDLHRLWINFKDAITSGDKAIYEECIRGEKKFVEEYRNTLKEDNLPETFRAKLSQQLNDAQRAIEDLDVMKESITNS